MAERDGVGADWPTTDEEKQLVSQSQKKPQRTGDGGDGIDEKQVHCR